MRMLTKRLQHDISLSSACAFEKPKQETILGILFVRGTVTLFAFFLHYARCYCK